MNTLKSGNYYTDKEVALKSGKSRITIFRWMQAGKIKPTYIGDLLRFHEKDVKHLFI